jgi:hypothetical protein
MPIAIQTILPELSPSDLDAVTGGAGTSGGGSIDLDAIRSKAKQYCPETAEKYSAVASSSLTRSKAIRMGNECLGEMGGFTASFARGPMMNAINEAFPPSQGK